VTRRRTVSASWFLPDQPEQAVEERGEVDNGRGTAEPWIKEGRNVVTWTKLSCRTLKDNEDSLT
jgi:hypothetical protein